MAAGAKTLSRILDLHTRQLLPSGASVLELGAQVLSTRGEEDSLRRFIDRFAGQDPRVRPAASYSDGELARFANKAPFGELLIAIGFEYKALDIFDAFNTILFDLNIHQPSDFLRNNFDLVTNFGTTEHIINQYLAMKSIHDFTKIGGLIYHDLPMSGYHQHGYFSYNPLFFEHLAQANDYEIVMQHYSKGGAVTAPPVMSENGYPDASYHDFGIEFILRKTSDAPFRMPLDLSVTLNVNNAVWTEADPNRADGAAARSPALAVDSGYSSSQARALDRVSGWDLQRELLSRYRKRVLRWLGG
jgi:hypothetical protein